MTTLRRPSCRTKVSMHPYKHNNTRLLIHRFVDLRAEAPPCQVVCPLAARPPAILFVPSVTYDALLRSAPTTIVCDHFYCYFPHSPLFHTWPVLQLVLLVITLLATMWPVLPPVLSAMPHKTTIFCFSNAELIVRVTTIALALASRRRITTAQFALRAHRQGQVII